jgi:hypothetical protein
MPEEKKPIFPKVILNDFKRGMIKSQDFWSHKPFCYNQFLKKEVIYWFIHILGALI